jgi:LysM repeat protein
VAGDTLISIARNFNIPVQPILEANPSLEPPYRVNPGQRIVLPVEVHTVTRGQTLYSIGELYGFDWRDIARVNRISAPYTIYVGQKLAIPGVTCDLDEAVSPPEIDAVPKHKDKKRALVLTTTGKAPGANAYVLLDCRGHVVLVSLDKAPDPASFGKDYNNYKVWLVTNGRYAGYRMHKTPHNVWTFRGPKPLTNIDAIVISAEGNAVTTKPTGPIVASGKLDYTC